MPSPRGGRRGRGGQRSGTPGAAYPNRTDLNTAPRTAPTPPRQPPRATPGQPYGAAGSQLAAQAAIPLPAVTPLTAPTQRPAEPVTAGMAMGAGPGPEALTLPSSAPALSPDEDLEATLMGLYRAHPNDDLARLLVVAKARKQRTPPSPQLGKRYTNAAPPPSHLPQRPKGAWMDSNPDNMPLVTPNEGGDQPVGVAQYTRPGEPNFNPGPPA